MSKQLVMKDTLVSAGRGQNTENFISGILILSLSHPHTKLLIKLFTQSPSEHNSTISDLMRQGLWTLRNARRNHSSSVLLTSWILALCQKDSMEGSSGYKHCMTWILRQKPQLISYQSTQSWNLFYVI